MGVTIKKKSTTTEPPPLKGQQPKPPGGLNAFYWYQIFALDSAVVEVQEMFSSHGCHLTNAMYHHGETLNQINTPWRNKEMAHNSQMVRAKENLKLSHGGSSYR